MRRLITVLLLALAAAWVAQPAAQAHNVLVGSDPKDGATLDAAPSRVTLVFDQAVRQGYAQVGVTGADGSSWADGSAEVAAERVSVRVKPLPAGGAYVVGYRILSADGHPVTGKITFTLSPGAAGAPATGQAPPRQAAKDAAAAEAAAGGGAGMAVVWIVGALLLLAAGTAVALRRSRPALAAQAQPASGPPPAPEGVQGSGPRPVPEDGPGSGTRPTTEDLPDVEARPTTADLPDAGTHPAAEDLSSSEGRQPEAGAGRRA
ncbi:copper resistance CopC family protein [Nonomuraea phyllanthi]|uniref:copper resistance CopC family protein n=1 Tax=Nonomuraea phyllanthi TaxID=2219224 RepID=UPI001D01D057|nr:copper resistance CopC family protein [Nonomuraea phyllanthi]